MLKRLITFDADTSDRCGGHFDALYDHLDTLKAALVTLIPAPGPQSVAQTAQ